ncbi:MAG: sigma 54-interacting transcriptional regulator [Pseudomonadota bacterium]
MFGLIRRIDNKYRVIKPLGGGGFSDVYLVEGPKGRCALKLLKGDFASLKKPALAEFKNEFSILKDMRHPNIASILDFGFDEELERYYYTSEIIDGRDLIKATKGIELEKITDLFVQALRALAYLHSYRIYHFDIKAANLLVIEGDKPLIKIIDFGLAGIDPRGRLIGTPTYMAPEIVAREHADARADLYSLGVLWYMAITHKNPFRGKTNEETLSRQLKFIPPLPSHIVSTVPAWLDQVVMRLLEKNPANRFASAASAIREINRLSGSEYPLETRETLLSYLPDESRFVGRNEEIDFLEMDLVRLRKNIGASSGCIVRGATGTGKTRLLKELKYRSQLKDIRISWASAQEPDVFSSWCDELSSHLNEGKGLVAFMLDDAQDVLRDEVTRAKLLALLSKARRVRAESSVWICLAMRPIEDEATRMSIEALVPIHIDVRAFNSEEMSEYIVSLTGLERPPELLLSGLFERTEGNPLFLTELLKSLIEGGGLFDEKGRWNAAIFEDMGVDFSKAAIPKTVGDLLLERTRGLSDEARSLLKTLSAINHPVSAAELGGYAGVPDSGQTVMDLLSRGILDRSEGFAVRFHNSLLGQALYENMPELHRENIHDSIASALKKAGAVSDEILEHMSLGSDKGDAFDAAFTLGEKALMSGRGEKAASYINRALAHVSSDDVEKRAEVQMKLGEAYLISHDYTAATEHFSAVEALISACAGTEAMARWRAEVLTRLGGTYIKIQEFDRARAAFHDARSAMNQSGGDGRLKLTIENFLGSIKFLEGHLDEAKCIFTDTRDGVTHLTPDEAERVTNNDLGMVLLAQGDADGADRIFRQDLERALKFGDDLLIGRAHYNIAQLESARANYDGAIDAYKQCIEVCRSSHNTELLIRAYNGLGNTYQISGDFDQSLSFYERGIALHERTGDLRGGAAIAINMGVVEAKRGAQEAALDHLVPAVEYLRTLAVKTAADQTALSRGLLELGDISKNAGQFDEARAKLEEARGIASKVSQAASQRFWILATLAEVAHAQKREGELSDLLGMLGPLATGDSERAMLEKLKQDFSISKSEREEIKASLPHQVEQANRYQRILDINKLISAESDLDYVLKTVLYYALDLTKAEAGAILLIDDKGEISVSCQRNMEGREEDVSFSSSLARKALESGQPVRTDDAMADDRFASEESVCSYGLRSILCFPVKARRRVIGALYLENRYQVGAFASADMELLDAFTDQVGLAIETARLLATSVHKEELLSSELAEVSRRAEHYEELLRQAPVEFKFDYGAIAGRSPKMQSILRTLDKIADTEISIFICGESGTGKELIAKALHLNHSKRNRGRFIAINCGAIPATLIESELFGYKAGAFTGAGRDKKGLIEEASGGTLFLDEIGELEPALQVKLLRVLQERECVRIGDTNPHPVDVRVIAASNRDIEGMLSDGSFREDLYYRICQMKIEVPPLRERLEDIPFLVETFIAKAAGDRKLSASPRLMRRFLSYSWPGNVRELENLIQVCCALVEGDVVDVGDIPGNHPIARGVHAPLTPIVSAEKKKEEARPTGVKIDEANAYDTSKSWKDYERIIMAKCYEANEFKARPTAKELGIAPTTFYSRIKEYGLDDRANVSYQETFQYTRGKTIEHYLPLVFKAALKATDGKAKDAIANLRISQGYFYKKIKNSDQ